MDVEKIKNLVEFDTPTVANGLGLLGVRDDSYGYTGPDIRALTPEFGARVGIAVTARMNFMVRLVQGHGFVPMDPARAQASATKRVKVGYVDLYPAFAGKTPPSGDNS